LLIFKTIFYKEVKKKKSNSNIAIFCMRIPTRGHFKQIKNHVKLDRLANAAENQQKPV